MALRSWIQQVSFTSIDAFEQFERVTLMLEINEVLIVAVNPNIGVRSPRPDNFLNSELVLGLQLYLLFPLEVASPGPLDLNGGDVVHRETVVLEQAASQ